MVRKRSKRWLPCHFRVGTGGVNCRCLSTWTPDLFRGAGRSRRLPCGPVEFCWGGPPLFFFFTWKARGRTQLLGSPKRRATHVRDSALLGLQWVSVGFRVNVTRLFLAALTAPDATVCVCVVFFELTLLKGNRTEFFVFFVFNPVGSIWVHFHVLK